MCRNEIQLGEDGTKAWQLFCMEAVLVDNRGILADNHVGEPDSGR